MSEDALSVKIINVLQKDNKSFYTLNEIQSLLALSSQRTSDLKKSIALLINADVIKAVNTLPKCYFIISKHSKDPKEPSSTQSSRKSSRKSAQKKLRVSVTNLSKYKINETTQIDDLPNDYDELQKIQMEMYCRKRKTEKQFESMKSKIKSTKKCGGENLEELTSKWMTVCRDLLNDIRIHPKCKDPNGETFSLSKLMDMLEVNKRLLKYDEDEDDFIE
ncbi:Swi5-dependent recombination DNA repair protein 1-like protein [Entamoeba marina]